MSTTAKNVSELQLTGFTIYTRASYLAKFGKPLPPCDPARRQKAWVGFGTFWFLESVNQPIIFKQETIAPGENLPNLEGFGPYPAYVVAPTAAFTDFKNAVPEIQAENPLFLSLQSDALALMNELGGSSLVDLGSQVPVITYPSGEQRRKWAFNDKQGIQVNVGTLLFNRNMHGVGAPGHWDQTGAVPSWVTDSLVPDTTKPPIGAPCRALAPNEKIEPSGVFGFATLVVDDGQPAPAPAGTADPSFTGADRQQLARLKESVDEILTLVQGLAQK